MRNNFISPHKRPFMVDLKRQRESMINSLINNLKINDVKEDADFQQTSEKIKNEILLKPVNIDEARFIDHEYEEIQLNMQQQFVGGGSKHHYYHQIEFPFTGDKELFEYIPETGYSQTSSDYGIILPDYNSITVYVDLPELNPNRAISKAKELLNLTLQLVSGNNSSISGWSESISNRIDNLLQKKREELIKIFG